MPEQPLGQRREFHAARAYIVSVAVVWILLGAGLWWGIGQTRWLGPDLKLWLSLAICGALGALAAMQLYGSFLSGPSLIVDADGFIYRDGKSVWGPVSWREVHSLSLVGGGARAVQVELNTAVRRRSIIGTKLVISDRLDGTGIIIVTPHSIDNQSEEAYAALIHFFEAAQ